MEERKRHLAEEAFKRRLVWVLAGWQAPPPAISKADVIAYLKTKPAAPAPLPEALVALRQRSALLSEFLADLHRDDPDLPVVALETAWPAPEETSTVAAPAASSAGAPAPEAAHAHPGALPPFLELIRRHDAADVVDRIRVFVRTFVGKDWRAVCAALPDEDSPEYAEEEAAEDAAAAAAATGGDSHAAAAAAASPGPPIHASSTPGGSPGLAAPARAPAAELRRFLGELEAHMAEHALWRGEVGTPAWEATLEALEKFVCAKVYAAVFGVHPRAARRDAALERRLRSLAFVSFRHLDLPEPPAFLAGGWAMAAEALAAMDRYENPSDKMACILNACRVVSTLLALATDARGGRDGGVGADEFLPALIYVVLHARPPRLYSNLRYIGEFSHPNKMNSEAGCECGAGRRVERGVGEEVSNRLPPPALPSPLLPSHFTLLADFYTNVFSAVSFARHVKPAHLSLSHGEFEQEVRAALEAAERLNIGRHRASLVPANAAILHAAAGASIAPRLEEERTGDGAGSESVATAAATPKQEEDLLDASRTMLGRLRDTIDRCGPQAGRHRAAAAVLPAAPLPVPRPPLPFRDTPAGGDDFASCAERGAAEYLEAYKRAGEEVLSLLQLLLVDPGRAP